MQIYVALDTETTGTDPERETIIEIGAVRFREDGRVLEEWSSLVNPQRPIPFAITQLTGITSQMVIDAPTLAHVVDPLRRFIGDPNTVILGHNLDFDLSFLASGGVQWPNPTIDTFELAPILLPTAGRYGLAPLADYMGILPSKQHRALEDARTTKDLFLALLRQAETVVSLNAIREISRLAAHSTWRSRWFFQQVERRRSQLAFSDQRTADRRAEAPFLPAAGPLFEEINRAQPLQGIGPLQPIDEEALASMLEPDGVFAQHFPQFEHRPPQVDMLRAVVQAFNHSGQLLVEAGTGVGKSLAYLLPAIDYAVRNAVRVVISTNTINLQDQLFAKDIPDLRQVLNRRDGADSSAEALADFSAAVLKGRTNYLCMRRLAAMRSRRDLSDDELKVLARVLVWLEVTQSGDQTELFLPTAQDRAVWLAVAASDDACRPDECTYASHGTCYFYRARRRAESAHLIIVNHALLLSDIAVDNRVLPEYKHVIVDEAHQLEAAITQQLSFSTDERRMTRLLSTLHSQIDGRPSGLLLDLLARSQQALPAELRSELVRYVTTLQALAGRALRETERFFDAIDQFVHEQDLLKNGAAYSQRVRILPAQRIQPAWSYVEIAWDDTADCIRQLAEGLQRLLGDLGELVDYDIPDHEDMVQNLGDSGIALREQVAQIGALVSQPSPAAIYWVEVGPPEYGQRISLHVAPLHIGPLVEKHLLLPKATVVLTSATLRTGGGFEFIQECLHAEEADTLAVGSPFDYAASTLLYLPTDMPEPDAPGYQKAVESALAALISAARGRTLALFTSYSQLRRTAEAIAPRLADEGITLLEQGGGGSRAQLLESFRTLDNAALLGTRSFWEGIDVMGPALSCLVISRLPFSVPSDPVFAARSESFDDPFYQYTVPETILRFRQGFGRLIRSKTDRGVVVVLDRRLQTKAYGKLFLDSLPECTVRRGLLAGLPRAAAEWIGASART
jgi:ATP-dependent DNA helicase DinG